ncbi:DUF977 family protein [Escherichia coli]|uniref:DUF977 family protein n=1 Tax=Escherichia coli TaxID=562 RepID=UPI002022CC10|nr:DUF977 family protein [Escherichia coli]
MAKVFTPEEREKIKGQVVELVRLSGRETLRQLEAKTGATRYLASVFARELVASGDVYNSGYGLFPSEQARKDWQNARKKLSRAKAKKPAVVDPDLIWSLPDGEIRRYDRRLNIICRECRNSEVMQRVLAFYQGVGSGGGAVSEISYQASISAGIRIKGEEHGNKTRR